MQPLGSCSGPLVGLVCEFADYVGRGLKKKFKNFFFTVERRCSLVFLGSHAPVHLHTSFATLPPNLSEELHQRRKPRSTIQKTLCNSQSDHAHQGLQCGLLQPLPCNGSHGLNRLFPEPEVCSTLSKLFSDTPIVYLREIPNYRFAGLSIEEKVEKILSVARCV